MTKQLPAIEVEKLSKVYNINHQKTAGYQTLRDSLVGALTKPLQLITGEPTQKEKFWALKDVSLKVNHGDVIGIVGRNGSGKSTLLKILSRIVEPTAGKITMRGRVASLLEVGTGFHPELTGRENIFFNGAILGMTRKEIESKFQAIVDFSEVERFLDTPVKFYSSGMYVRLAFAIAAHLEPDILIVDEVLAVGDTAFQKKCLGKMRDVAGEGRTVLFVSHSMETIAALCSKAIMLENGRIKAQGTTDEVLAVYTNRALPSSAEFTVSSSLKSTNIRLITLLNSSKQKSLSFNVNERIGMKITETKRTGLTDKEVYINIINSNGSHIAVCKGIWEEGALMFAPALAPGEYGINLVIRNGLGSDDIFLEDAARFSVLGSSSVPNFVHDVAYS